MKAIRGGLDDYCEGLPDEGAVDFVKVIRILRDAGFSGSICPDHMPKHPDDPGGFMVQRQVCGDVFHGHFHQAINFSIGSNPHNTVSIEPAIPKIAFRIDGRAVR